MKALIVSIASFLLTGCLVDNKGTATANSAPSAPISLEGHWVNSEAPLNPNGMPYCTDVANEFVCQPTLTAPTSCNSAPTVNGYLVYGSEFIVSNNTLKIGAGGSIVVSIQTANDHLITFENVTWDYQAFSTDEIVVTYIDGCSVLFKKQKE